jgi:hypothetical protein
MTASSPAQNMFVLLSKELINWNTKSQEIAKESWQGGAAFDSDFSEHIVLFVYKPSLSPYCPR